MAELFVTDDRKWEFVRDTVEGRQSPASCSVQDGKIGFHAASVGKRAEPNLKLLSQILRSDEPLPAVAREWLADLFDPDAESEFRVKELSRRARGPGKTGVCHNWDAAAYAEARMELGDRADDPQARDPRPDKYADAVNTAARKFSIQPSAVKAAIKTRRSAQAAHDAIE
ncbi:hypothetical protein [Sphingobium sp. CR28]|uniref:hypothetical protein n=1 Tax=Sphingobium sp. CR28 TaxID=3400272 RepID=UPI003FEF61D9